MQLVGKVNGMDIILNCIGDNVYSTTIPKQITGVYIVELHLVNDDGLEQNYSNIFVRIDFQSMNIKMLDSSYAWTEGSGEYYGYREILPQFQSVEVTV